MTIEKIEQIRTNFFFSPSIFWSVNSVLIQKKKKLHSLSFKSFTLSSFNTLTAFKSWREEVSKCKTIISVPQSFFRKKRTKTTTTKKEENKKDVEDKKKKNIKLSATVSFAVW